jgi:hypothetical protein
MAPANQPTEFYDIILTDIQLHVQKTCNTRSLYRAAVKSIRNKKPGRAYTSAIKMMPDGRFQIRFDSPDMQKQIAAAERAGKTIRFLIPRGGLPVFVGKDTIEFIKAHPNICKNKSEKN